MNAALAARLIEGADAMVDDLPPETREVSDLEGDVGLDERDLYCANLMRQAAKALSGDGAPTVATFEIPAKAEGVTFHVTPIPELPTNPDPPQAA